MTEEISKSKVIKFLCYRYAVIPNGQTSIWQEDGFRKRLVMDEIVSYCSENGPYSATYSGVEAVLLYTRSIGETAHLFKFCRKQRVKRYEMEPDQSDIAERELDSYPYVYVIIDTSFQLVLIQRKSTVFKNAGGAKAALSALVKQFLSDENYYYSLDEITASTSFWDTVDNADEVYDVTLKLKSPNFLGSGYNTTDMLRRLQSVTNNDKVSLKLSNSSGELKMPRDEYDDAIEYITAGGGSWSATTSTGGARRITHKSDEFVKTVEVKVSEQRPLDDGEIIIAIRGAGAKRSDGDDADHVGS